MAEKTSSQTATDTPNTSCFSKKLETAKRFLQTVTLDGDTPFYYYWLLIISAAFLYNAIFVPLRASFCDFNADYLTVFLVLDYVVCDVVYLIDIFIKSRMRYYQQGIQVDDAKLLQKRYLHSRQFVIDVISILPTDLIYIGYGFDYYTAVRLNRLLRYARLFEMITRIESTSSFPNAFRLLTTVLGTATVLYYGLIFYNSYSKAVGYGETDDDYPYSKEMAEKPFLTRFMHCLYWSCMTLIFIGEMPMPKTPLERIIEIVAWLSGLTMFGVIVGRLAQILENMNTSEDSYYRQLSHVREYLNFQKVPPEVTSKIVKWFGYAYENNVLGSADKVLKPLPDKLKSELAMDMHLAALKKVQLFADLETTLLTELVTRFKLQVFSPQDYVCKKGDIGREMYVVRIGSIEVVSDDGTKVFVTLGPGTVFGEISLLSIPGSRTGNRRTANIRSKGYSTLFSLSKADLYAVLEDYPGAMNKLVEKGTEILRKEKKLDEDSIAKKEAEEAELAIRFDKITKTLEETEQSIAMLTAAISYNHNLADRRLSLIESEVAKRTGAKSAPPRIMDRADQDEDEKKPSDNNNNNKQTKKTVKFSDQNDVTSESDTTDSSSDENCSAVANKNEPGQQTTQVEAPSVSTNDKSSVDIREESNDVGDDGPPAITVVPATPESPDESEQSERGSSAASDDVAADVNSYFYDTA